MNVTLYICWGIILLPHDCVSLAVGHTVGDPVQKQQAFSKVPSLKHRASVHVGC